MTRWLVAFTIASAALAYSNSGGLRPFGIAGVAAISVLMTFQLAGALRRRAALRTLEGLRALHPDDFEAEVARWLRRDGWRVEQRGGTGDGGIDILARKRRETLAVQCKRYAETAAVSAAQVRDLYGAAVATGATAAILVTTGRVSGPATAWAESLPPGASLAFHDSTCLAQLASGRARLA